MAGMAVDNYAAQGRQAGAVHPAVALVRQILDAEDDTWVHEQAGVDRLIIRKFRAQRRRSFYSCIDVLREDAREARLRWQGAAERLQDYGGMDWPLEQAKFQATLGWVCLVAECQWTLGVRLNAAWRERLVRHFERAADFTSFASAAN
jgi:hypothetical protein